MGWNGIGWGDTEWNGMGWSRMEWDHMEWDGWAGTPWQQGFPCWWDRSVRPWGLREQQTHPWNTRTAHMDLLCVRDYWQDSLALQSLQDAEFTSGDWLKLWIPPLATWTLLPVPSALAQHPACTCEPPHNHTCSSLCLWSKWKSNFISFKSREDKERYLFSSCLA